MTTIAPEEPPLWTTTVYTISGEEEEEEGGDLGYLQSTTIQRHTAEYALSIFLIVIGIVGNSMNLVVLKRFDTNAVYFYLRALATCDLIYCISVVGGALTLTVRVSSISYGFAWFYTYIVFPLILIAPVVGSCITMMVCVTRFILVKFPMKGKICIRMSGAKICLAVAVTVITLVRGYIVYRSVTIRRREVTPDHVSYSQSWTQWFSSERGRRVWLCMAIVFEHGLTLALALISILMLLTLRRHKRKVAKLISTASSDEHEKEKQLILMVTSIVLLHAISTAPYTVIRLMRVSHHIKDPLRRISQQLFLLNHSINFWMYLVNHGWFRKETKRVLEKIFKSIHIHKARVDSSTGPMVVSAPTGTSRDHTGNQT